MIIVASVSCIYGLGSPEQYEGQLLRLVQGVEYPMTDAIRRLVDIQYERNEINLVRGSFESKGTRSRCSCHTTRRSSVSSSSVMRSIASCGWIPITGEVLEELNEVFIFPASHYVTEKERMERAVTSIEIELRIGSLSSRAKGNCSKPNGCG